MKNIYLCGFMGCGKTTIGQQLATQFGIGFLDTDQEIERRQGKRITELFLEGKEKAFRRMEQELLHEFSGNESLVIALGGGMLLPSRNATYAKGTGRVVLLELPFEECYRRISADQTRPLPIQMTKKELAILYRRRRSCYWASADFAIAANHIPLVCAKQIHKIILDKERRFMR